MLQALALLARSPDGLRADETAVALGRSVSTAYSLLDSLCQEGFAVHEERGAYRLAAAGQAAAPREDIAAVASLAGVLDELFVRTNKRCYLAGVRRGTLVVPAKRGRQGMRRMSDLGTTIGDNAHALALGKVALAELNPNGLASYVGRGLKQFTQHTIVRADRLFAELEDVRTRGVAVDREEHELGFCCLAAPVFNEHDRAVGILGISTSARSFDSEREELQRTLLELANGALAAGRAAAEPALPENGRRS